MQALKRLWHRRRLARIERRIEQTAASIRELNRHLRQLNHQHIQTAAQLQVLEVTVQPLQSLVRNSHV